MDSASLHSFTSVRIVVYRFETYVNLFARAYKMQCPDQGSHNKAQEVVVCE